MNESMNEYYLMNTKLLRKAGWSYALHTHVSYVRTYYVRTYCLYVWQRGTLGRTTSKPWLLKSAELVFASITEYSTFIIYRLTWLLPFLEIWFDRRPSRILIVVASSSRSWYRSLLLVRPPHYSTTGVSARCVDDVVAVVAVVVGDKQESLGQYSRSSIVNRQSSILVLTGFVVCCSIRCCSRILHSEKWSVTVSNRKFRKRLPSLVDPTFECTLSIAEKLLITPRV